MFESHGEVLSVKCGHNFALTPYTRVRVSEHLCMLVSLVKVATRRRAALIMLLRYHTHTTELMVSWYRLLLVTHSSCRAYAEDTEAMTMHAKPNPRDLKSGWEDRVRIQK